MTWFCMYFLTWVISKSWQEMANTTRVQYTRTHSTAHVSNQRSQTIQIMKEIILRVEDGLSCDMSQELQVGISRNQGMWRITSYVGYNHDQGALVLLSVIFMAAGVWQSSKSQSI